LFAQQKTAFCATKYIHIIILYKPRGEEAERKRGAGMKMVSINWRDIFAISQSAAVIERQKRQPPVAEALEANNVIYLALE